LLPTLGKIENPQFQVEEELKTGYRLEVAVARAEEVDEQ